MPTCATQEETSIDAQNPNHTCPRKYFVFAACCKRPLSLAVCRTELMDFDRKLN